LNSLPSDLLSSRSSEQPYTEKLCLFCVALNAHDTLAMYQYIRYTILTQISPLQRDLTFLHLLRMHITWLGSTAIKIQTKPDEKEITVVIDPYRPKTGQFPRSLAPDLALFTRGEDDAITLSGNPFVLSSPGEIETKGILVASVQGHEPNTVMFRIDVEQMSVGHLGLANKPLTDAQELMLSGVDILFVPVGGKGGYDADAAAKAVNMLEPRVVIPIAFKSDTNPTVDDVQPFLKEMGAKITTPEKKVILKKKDLPEEETQVIVLAKE